MTAQSVVGVLAQGLISMTRVASELAFALMCTDQYDFHAGSCTLPCKPQPWFTCIVCVPCGAHRCTFSRLTGLEAFTLALRAGLNLLGATLAEPAAIAAECTWANLT